MDNGAWLRGEYVRRRDRNSAYSLRAFARQIGLGSGPLSEILAGRRTLTRKTADRIIGRLGLSDGEARAVRDRIDAGSGAGPRPDSRVALSGDTFELIADWHHYAILSLLATPLRSHSPRSLALRLGISPLEARAAIERLERLRLLRRERGRLRPTGVFTTTHDVPSAAIRRFHRQVLERAARSLDTVSVEERDVTCLTLAIDKARIAEAKRRILEFRRSMAELLERGRPTEVYHLSISLFPAKGGTT